MRGLTCIAIVLLLAPVVVAQTPPPILLPEESDPALHANLLTTAHPDAVMLALEYSKRWQQADGGVYQYYFFHAEAETVNALNFWARLQPLDARGPNMTALIGYFERNQSTYGSWGSGFLVDSLTAEATDGLLQAGVDPHSEMMRKARWYIEWRQNDDGSWNDGPMPSATFVTATNMKNLLAFGESRGHDRIQDAVEFILSTQNGNATNREYGGFPPVPTDSAGAAFTTLPVPTAEVIDGLLAYLRAPPAGDERVSDADVEAAIARAITYLERMYQPRYHHWQDSYSASCYILAPLYDYHRSRGLPLPAYVANATAAVLENQSKTEGYFRSWNGSPILDYTFRCGRALLGVSRDIGWADRIPVQVTLNDLGEYQDGAVTATLTDATGRIRVRTTLETGFGNLTWEWLPDGLYTLRLEAPGAVPYEAGFPIRHGAIPAPPVLDPVFAPLANLTANEGAVFTFTVTATHPEDQVVTLALTGKPVSATFTSVDGAGTFRWTPEALARGVYPLTFRAAAEGGGVSYQNVTLTVLPGTQAPVAAFTLPQYAKRDANVTVADASRDPDGGAIVARHWSFGDGAEATTANATHAYGTDGRYNVTLTVTDDDGATASLTRSLLVDGVAPAATATVNGTEVDGTLKDSALVTLRASDNANGSGIESIRYRLDGGAVRTSPGNTTVTVATTGTHTIEYWAVDRAGNAAAPQTLTFTVDADAPQVEIVSPGDLSLSRRVTFTTNVQEATPAGTRVTYYVDGERLATFSGTGTHSVTRIIGAGSHVFRVEARDAVGHVTVSETEFLVVWLT